MSDVNGLLLSFEEQRVHGGYRISVAVTNHSGRSLYPVQAFTAADRVRAYVLAANYVRWLCASPDYLGLLREVNS